MENEPRERTAREAREHFADMINDAIRGRVTYITGHGRRVAAVVPLAVVDKAAAAVPVVEFEYDDGQEAAERGDWTPSEVAAQSASFQLGYRDYEAAAKRGEAM